MNVIDDLADRLGVSRWVVWVGIAAAVVAVVIIYRRMTGASGTSANSAGDVLNGPFSSGFDGTTANQNPTSPDGGADTGTTSAPFIPPPNPPRGPVATAGPRKVTTIVLPSDMTWPQIAQTYTGSSNNANWLLSWNAQLHSQSWYTVAKGTRINVPQ